MHSYKYIRHNSKPEINKIKCAGWSFGKEHSNLN